MNIFKLITPLQNSANSASATPLDLMTLSRTVKAMKSGTIQTVANTSLLPTTLTTSGNIYYIESEEDLYYNIGSTWDLFYTPGFALTYGWGDNSVGQLGDNTITTRSSPVTVVGGITNWSKISGGFRHSLGVTSSGIAYAWGQNTYGQLGDNTISSRLSPVPVIGGIANWSQISGGNQHSVGLTASGIAYAWGQNIYGQLGDNTTSNRSSPVTVVGGITTWSQLSAGFRHVLGRTSGGIAYAWGGNSTGQLGNNTATDCSSPVTVVGSITNWSELAGGQYHSLGLRVTGIAYAWGGNTYGRLGDNTATDRSSPVTIVGGITTWSQLSCSSYGHSLGRISTGIAYAWGFNSATGSLGDNTLIDRSSPVTVVGGITNWIQLSAGLATSFGVTSTGIAYGWGGGGGRVGDGTTTARSSPVTVVGGITNWSQISGGFGDQSLGLSITPNSQ